MATALLLLLLTAIAVDAAATPLPSSGRCAVELRTSFSPCLPYVSSPPNNLTGTASTACCDAFSAATAVDSLCFCHLLRDPVILGFPLNTTRLLSLSSVCPTAPRFLCSESPALPHLTIAEKYAKSIHSVTALGGGGGRGGGGGSRGGGARVLPFFPGGGGGGGNRKSGSSSSMAGGGFKSLLVPLTLAIFVTLNTA
ncbi:non-specific lipid transfer protein GPI-anchored 25-like [Lotus japonicus]|uniref:non-specific lipid transfer protein GPI-anchored 25-like n=1 Tax=Lotus japonicus TaxID=34305 RepID=UPI002585F7BC|nr:non-specific lipid transfer protein GPI-anchored 25-like [Lotus japonicus]